MNPVTHFCLSWLVADAGRLDRKERAIVTAAGVVPDIDGLGIIPQLLTDNSSHPLLWYSEYHHVVAHNLFFGLLVTTAAFFLSRQKWKIALLAFFTFHLHLICDLVGSRGPDYVWPIWYFYPFSKNYKIFWNGQWELNAWPNILITVLALFFIFYRAWKRGYSPLEMFSKKGDALFVKTLRNRFGNPS